jgi:hypothetical protein
VELGKKLAPKLRHLRSKRKRTKREKGQRKDQGRRRNKSHVPFPVLSSTLSRSRFQAKPATLMIPIYFPFLFAVEELYGTRY